MITGGRAKTGGGAGLDRAHARGNRFGRAVADLFGNLIDHGNDQRGKPPLPRGEIPCLRGIPDRRTIGARPDRALRAGHIDLLRGRAKGGHHIVQPFQQNGRQVDQHIARNRPARPRRQARHRHGPDRHRVKTGQGRGHGIHPRPQNRVQHIAVPQPPEQKNRCHIAPMTNAG